MPNWCENNVVISFTKAVWEEERAAFMDALKMDSLLQYIKPDPNQENKDKYNWNCENWGTKWDVEADLCSENEYKEDGEEMIDIVLYFHSAWGPPCHAFNGFSKARSVSIEYFESGMMFGGVCEFRNGDLVNDEYAQISYEEIAKLSDWHHDRIESMIEHDELCKQEYEVPYNVGDHCPHEGEAC